MSNPFMEGVERDARNGYAGFRERGVSSARGPQQHGQPQQYGQQYGQPQTGGPIQTSSSQGERAMTIDDVLMKTAALFVLLLAAAVPAWLFAPTLGPVLVIGSIVATLGMGFALAFVKGPAIPLVVVFALFEGVLVGSVSRFYATAFDEPGTPIFQGIVAQAVLGTVCVFAAMLFLYRARIIKVTEKFRSMVTMALAGYMLFALVNLAYVWFFDGPMFGFGGSSLLGIGISLFAVGLASVTLALDFDTIEKAITTGAPVKYSWRLSLGLIVTLVWLYLEMLRLLARLRSN